MKFFYIAHGTMSLQCLKDLVSKGYKPGFTAVHKEYDRESSNEKFYEPMKKFCAENDIPHYEVERLSKLDIEIASCETGICVGFMEIIHREVFELPKFGILNLHCGKLPKYRGRAPISRAIINDENFVTMTLHKMDEGVDSGDVLCEMEIPIGDEDDANNIYNICSAQSHRLVINGLNFLDTGNYEYKKQDLDTTPYANRKLTEAERRINWNDSVKNIYNLIRAVTPPYPAAITRYGKDDFLVTRAELFEYRNGESIHNGEIIKIEESDIYVNCRNGILKIKQMTDIEGQLINSLAFQTGEKFE